MTMYNELYARIVSARGRGGLLRNEFTLLGVER